jgi:hypothetical protein
MSTPTDAFDTDYSKLQADAQAFIAMQNELKQAEADYQAAYQKLLKECPLMAIILLISNPGCTMLQDNLGISGAGLQIQGDLSKLGNDMENDTNSKDTTTGDSGLVAKVAGDLDKTLDMLDPNSSDPVNQAIQQGIGPTGAGFLHQEYLTIRQDINWEHDSIDGNKYNPASGATYHFDVDNSQYIQSYGEMQNEMSQQGDPKSANEAAKIKTDAFNMNTSTTQSTNAASNEMITNQKNIITSWQSLGSSLMHNFADLVKAAIQNMSRG